MTFRIASYNLHKCVGTDGQRDPERILAVINALSADVVALQEVDRRMGNRPAALPASLIDRETDFRIADLPRTGPESLGWHGQAVLLRKGGRIDAADGFLLPGLEPRGALRLVIEPKGLPPVTLIAAHLGLRRMDRRLQWEEIAARMRDAQAPALAIGDFNEWSRQKGFEALTPFDLHIPGPSYPSRAPIGRLDRLVTGPGLKVERMGVFDSPLARRASDHLPIWADIEVTKPRLITT
ncbi:endonuclease/exonuclease/phosphatase family protein [Paenirhodobacter populi]|uniref:Metal-dependent hydrolase n=1 Tax=Paenirhodobacter populi TaxID=2306993 RepID=A0A443KJ97_9RHOB|nr:endonuclease/exonuclease/phosphatase family protein [Sinirhodobacter populi]RWR10679.1 metal-dependent hydrolase [Sinirhodobacter populi]RWR14697.1 metal-dependent hydrolase [Sinirhodobacter populi]RWR32839.1 metal-dependent hydrolase [Sinirhodobacter populi]